MVPASHQLGFLISYVLFGVFSYLFIVSPISTTVLNTFDTCSPACVILYHVTGSCKEPAVFGPDVFYMKNVPFGEISVLRLSRAPSCNTIVQLTRSGVIFGPEMCLHEKCSIWRNFRTPTLKGTFV